jgi:hypothetical protein
MVASLLDFPIQVLRSSNDRHEPLSNRREAYAEPKQRYSELGAIRSFRLPVRGGRQASRRTSGMDRTQDDLLFLLRSAIRHNPLAKSSNQDGDGAFECLVVSNTDEFATNCVRQSKDSSTEKN